MLSLGLLEAVSLIEKVEYCYKVAELKELLSIRGLKVSVKKADQAMRLVDADPGGIDKLCGHRKLARCTPEARQAVEEWLSEQATSLNDAVDALITSMSMRQFKASIHIADRYREGVFQPPQNLGAQSMTIKLSPKSLEERAAEVERIFRLRPSILNGLREEEWLGLHLNYAIWQLLGWEASKQCQPGFSGFGAMSPSTVLLMMSFFVRHQDDLNKWRDLGFKNATIHCCNSGSCNECMGGDNKVYRLDRLPELPNKNCTCALGCRCYASPDIDFS